LAIIPSTCAASAAGTVAPELDDRAPSWLPSDEATGGNPSSAAPAANPTISGQWFLAYRNGVVDTSIARFTVDRGYINIKHRLTPRLSGRMTPDVTIDQEGDGEGDVEVRLKYCYADIVLGSYSIFYKSHFEFGLVHRPWLDFEEHINLFRVQGTMFVERNGLINSADFGLTVFSLLGGEMDQQYQREVNSHYAGRYGSVAVGVYNGGGYHALEKNTDKSIEARISLRPLPDRAPGLQVTYHGVHGDGNQPLRPRWTMHLGMLSFEHRRLAATAQLYAGTGDFKGQSGPGGSESIDQWGYSVFGELRFFDRRISVIGRYDEFDDRPESSGDNRKRLIFGASYHIEGRTQVLLDYDMATRSRWFGDDSRFFKAALEYHF
jgi:hypothetical protein